MGKPELKELFDCAIVDAELTPKDEGISGGGISSPAVFPARSHLSEFHGADPENMVNDTYFVFALNLAASSFLPISLLMTSLLWPIRHVQSTSCTPSSCQFKT